MIKCGFISENKAISIEEITEEELQELLNNINYTSISMDDEYYIFISKGLNTEDISEELLELNKILLCS